MKNLKKNSMIVVSLVIIVIGFILHTQSAIDEAEGTISTSMNYVFSPIDSISSNPFEIHSFDGDAYMDEAKGHILKLPKAMFDFKKSLESGVIYLISGFSLLIITTRKNLESFIKSVFNLVF